jgi:predicted hotdog family 3-hydroxylacyl-ACP dehydratase
MCLLDEVLDWNAGQIRCRTATHRAPDNPLRAHDRLSVLCGIEYAAQTMALHGALAGGAANISAVHAGAMPSGVTHTGAVGLPQMGLLAGIRAVRCSVLRLDDVESDLICEVTHVAGDGLTALYEFALYEFGLRDQGRMLLSGRASVVLDAGRHLRK